MVPVGRGKFPAVFPSFWRVPRPRHWLSARLLRWPSGSMPLAVVCASPR